MPTIRITTAQYLAAPLTISSATQDLGVPVLITAAGSVINTTTTAIYATAEAPWIVRNFGSVSATAGTGIQLAGAGEVDNGSKSHQAATIYGHDFGVSIAGYGYVSNAGTIQSAGIGVDLLGGGILFNRAGTINGNQNGIAAEADTTIVNSAGGSITGNVYGVYLDVGDRVINAGFVAGGAAGISLLGGSVTNTGTILGSADGIFSGYASSSSSVYYAVHVDNSGTIIGEGASFSPAQGRNVAGHSVPAAAVAGITANVTNRAGGYLGDTNEDGIWTFHNSTVVNAGSISGGYAGIFSCYGSIMLTNGASGIVHGGSMGAVFASLTTTVINAGQILSDGGTGVYACQYAFVANRQGGTISGHIGVGSSSSTALGIINSGSIYGTGYGVNGGGVYVTNLATGIISSGTTGPHAAAIYAHGGGTVRNAGEISGGTNAIQAAYRLTVTNTAGGTISSPGYGILLTGTGPLSITNAGTIASLNRAGIMLSGGGTLALANNAGGYISGDDGVVSVSLGATNDTTIANNGTIHGAHYGVYATATATITNGRPGLHTSVISGNTAGIVVAGAASIDNQATITGGSFAIKVIAAVPVSVTEHQFAHFGGGVIAGNDVTTLHLANDHVVGHLDASTLRHVPAIDVAAAATWAIPQALTLDQSPLLSLGAGADLEVPVELLTTGNLTLASAGRVGVGGAMRIGSGDDALTPHMVDIEPATTLSATGSLAARTVLDQGTLAIPASGALALHGAVGGAGTVSLGALALFSLTGAPTANLDFAGASATLELLNPLGVSTGTISNFVAGDTIELASFGSYAGTSASGTSIVLAGGAGSTTLNFASYTLISITNSSGNLFITHT